MLRGVNPVTVCWDCEWVPCVASGRRVYGMAATASDRAVCERMWQEAKATPEVPRPFLKLALSQVVSIAAVVRTCRDSRVDLELATYPSTAADWCRESDIIEDFLEFVAGADGQLVGFNSTNADLPILIQRGILTGAQCPRFCRRPAKPWEGRDYFSSNSDAHVDLLRILGAGAHNGAASPSLDQAANAAGFPCKIGTAGDDVAELWLRGEHQRIINYNETDALATYLLWLRTACFCGLMSRRDHDAELELATAWIASLATFKPHFAEYLARWQEIPTSSMLLKGTRITRQISPLRLSGT